MSSTVVASTVMKLIASRAAVTKADIVRVSGLARTTVDNALAPLFTTGAVRHAGIRPAVGRGRPAEELEIAPTYGVVLVADCGVRAAKLAVFDFGQQVLASSQVPIDLSRGPQPVLDDVIAGFTDLVEKAGVADAPRTAVIGLPGPVDQRHGAVVRPPLMPGWDGFGVVAALSEALGCQVLIENDVNLRALGEQRVLSEAIGPLVYLKCGTGIGSGLVTADGMLLHGADGAAGDIGHVRVVGSDDPCPCGNTGCLEAYASLRALAGVDDSEGEASSEQVEQFLDVLRARDARAVALLRDRAPAIGEVVVSLVHVLNPAIVVVGGAMAAATDDLLAAVRSVVYQRSLPLATRNLTITGPQLGDDSGLYGGLALGLEAAMEPAALHDRLAALRPGRRRSR
ncbi:ROK family protein [Aestuariimicrobium ganziense]|uniref:ROK family protein n=1 Tax=Aestuariimicrobium ganziense TaxID=2773677 RepID=UPI0019449308|nr:ROK family protein [Aestuariimicrobium ganziense]